MEYVPSVRVGRTRLSVQGNVMSDACSSQICRLAEELNVRVVVVGSHGKGAIRKALLGSVSDYLTRHCTRPVLVVRDKSDSA